ncbi:MAG: hypothetical protein NC924_07890 [Candidatus Omnitrophica bacterium]|nr:hypothetical protein [Candidatus Omnitrophota bacterium]
MRRDAVGFETRGEHTKGYYLYKADGWLELEINPEIYSNEEKIQVNWQKPTLDFAAHGYVIQVFRDNFNYFPSVVRITDKNKKKCFEGYGALFTVGNFEPTLNVDYTINDDEPYVRDNKLDENHGWVYDTKEKTLDTRDITGDGQPNLIIINNHGGCHGCQDFFLFSLGKEFKLIFRQDMDGHYGEFKDIDGDGVFEFVGYDSTFQGWYTCPVDSPMMEIVLRYRDGKYKLARDLMAEPLPAYAVEAEVRREAEDELSAYSPIGWCKNDAIVVPPVWRYMLQLIYTGHPNDAWLFLDRYWRWGWLEKQSFLEEFKSQLSQSPYAADLPLK